MRAVRRTAKFAAKTVTFLIAPFVGFTASQDRWSACDASIHINHFGEQHMGIKTHTLADGSLSFEADIRIKGVDRKTKTFETREQAEEFVDTIKAAARRAVRSGAAHRLAQKTKTGGPRAYNRALLADVVVRFAASTKCSERTKKSLIPVAAFLEDVTVEQADEAWTEDYVERVRKMPTHIKTTYAYSTINAQLLGLAAACKWWAKETRVKNPEIGISNACFPKEWENKRERRIEEGEYDRIMAQAALQPSRKTHWRCVVELGIETGARLQELILANWSEIQCGDQLWKIPAAHTKKKRKRKVPLSAKARQVIAELRTLRQPGDTRLFQVFPNPSTTSDQFGDMIGKTGIEDFRFHDLRHEAISKMCTERIDVPVKIIMDIVGHKTYAAFNRYSHLRDGDLVGLFG
jgi:integrase